MATSGVTQFQPTRNEIIEAAMRKIGVLAEGQVPSSDNYTTATYALNALLGEFRVLGMPLWKRSSLTFTPTVNVNTYNINTGEVFSGVTIAVPYPLKIYQAYRTDTSSTTKVQMDILADYNFNLLPSNSSGLPISITYTPYVNHGVLKMWPTPDASAVANCTITLVYQAPMEYSGNSIQTLDIPEEWLSAVIYNLASRIAPEWGIPLPDRQLLEATAEKLLNRALDFGAEDGSLYFQVDRKM